MQERKERKERKGSEATEEKGSGARERRQVLAVYRSARNNFRSANWTVDQRFCAADTCTQVVAWAE